MLSDSLPRNESPRGSTFSFLATESLAGYPSPCANPGCRLQNVDSLSRFAALYADEIILPDPFSDFHAAIQNPTYVRDRWLLLDIASHIAILHLLEPLIEDGIISFTSTSNNSVCMECYAKALGEVGGRYSINLDSMRKLIKKKAYGRR